MLDSTYHAMVHCLCTDYRTFFSYTLALLYFLFVFVFTKCIDPKVRPVRIMGSILNVTIEAFDLNNSQNS
jgi:hypothetical protein